MNSRQFLWLTLCVALVVLGEEEQARYDTQGRTRNRYYVEFNASAALSRQAEASAVRQIALELQEENHPIPIQLSNADELYYPNYIGQFHKTLPHNAFGEVDPVAYQTMVNAIHNKDDETLETLPGSGRLTDPLSGFTYALVGSDPAAFQIQTPPSWASETIAASMVELYWWALLRDVPYAEWDTNPLVQQAAASVGQMPGYAGPKNDQGVVTPAELFRNNFPGVRKGPFIPQFYLKMFFFDGIPIPPKMATAEPNYDYMTSVRTWLEAQNGFPNGPAEVDVLANNTVFPRTWRDLGRIVLDDQIIDTSFRAALILFKMGLPIAGPYGGTRMAGFTNFGTGHICAHMGHASSAGRECWFQKWNLHRYLRPEAYAGLVHFTKTGQRSYPIPKDLLQNPVLDLIYAYNAQQNLRLPTNDSEHGVGTYFLPQMDSVGCPTHPSYPSGHAVFVGAGVTLLKAWYGNVCDQPWPSPLVPSADGQTLEPYTGGDLTICGELNKLAYGVAYARSAIGVHWRMDAEQGMLLGEDSAIRMLQEELNCGMLPNGFPQGWRLEKFDGTVITIQKQT